jgi:hypothetical protein
VLTSKIPNVRFAGEAKIVDCGTARAVWANDGTGWIAAISTLTIAKLRAIEKIIGVLRSSIA